MSSPLAEVDAKIAAALKLLDSETADAIIRDKWPEYETLADGMQAAQTLCWVMMRRHGLRDTGMSREMMAKHLIITATILHYAYALGMRRGRERMSDKG